MPGIQEALALAIVVAVVAVVVYRRRRRGAAHGCADCAPGAGEPQQEKTLQFYRRARPADDQTRGSEPR